MPNEPMKETARKQNLLPVLVVGLGSALVGQLAAQTFITLHNFSGNSDGANPQAGLFLSGNMLYGTTTYGGSTSNGTVFAVNTAGTSFTNLYNFTGLTAPVPFGVNND